MGCTPSNKDIFIETAKNASSLKELSVDDIKIEKQPFYDFLNEVSRNHNLEVFRLKKVEIVGDFKKMISITNTLRYKKTLKTLELIELPNLGEKKGKACQCLIDELPLLEKFIFQESELDDSDQEYISNIIAFNKKHLTYLDISGNYFAKRIIDLLKSFKDNDSIKTLILEKMYINQHCIDVLLYALENNKSLLELRLSNNPLKHGVDHFKAFFRHGHNLTKLILINCDLNDMNFGSIMEALRDNKSLLELNLNYNGITKNGVFILKAFFEKNQTLMNIYMLSNKICIKDLEFTLYDVDLKKCIVEY